MNTWKDYNFKLYILKIIIFMLTCKIAFKNLIKYNNMTNTFNAVLIKIDKINTIIKNSNNNYNITNQFLIYAKKIKKTFQFNKNVYRIYLVIFIKIY